MKFIITIILSLLSLLSYSQLIEYKEEGSKLQYNINGSTFKAERGVQFCAEYQEVYDSMPVKPSAANAIIQNALLKTLVDKGYYAKAELIDIFAVDTILNAKINWANPGTFNPITVNSPTFTKYGGFKSATSGSKYIRLNFNPTTNGTKVYQDSICAIIGIGDSIIENSYDFGGKSGSTYFLLKATVTGATSYTTSFHNAGTEVNIANPEGEAHLTMSRSSATTYLSGFNTFLQSNSKTTNGFVNVELYAGGWNNAGTPTISNKTISYVIIIADLLPYEIRDIIGIMEEYLANYDKGLIDYTIATPIHSSKRLITPPTSIVNNNEVIHPSVVDIGHTWHGYRYWQANTPYPDTDGKHEIPEVYASNDGVNWVVPSGLTNPIFPYDGINHYYSDPDLFFENDTLYLFFRTTKDPGSKSKIKVIKTANGITWNTNSPKVVLGTNGTNEVVTTPSIVKIGETYYMYSVSDSAIYDPQRLIRRSSSALTGTYTNPEAITIPFLAINHLSAFVDGSEIYLAIGNSANKGIFICKSTDGTTFVRENNANPNIYQTALLETTTVGYYRPELVKMNGVFYVYYSIMGNATTEESIMFRQKLIMK